LLNRNTFDTLALAARDRFEGQTLLRSGGEEAIERGVSPRYSGPVTVFNLRTVRLQSGDQFRDVREVELEPLELGGQRYVPIPEKPEAALTLTRMSSGLMLELEFAVRLVGPCMRCLTDAAVALEVKGREYQATNPGESDELTTPYIADDRLDLSAWARDAIALLLPDKILCRDDCAGLCPVCGRDLNAEPHEHEEAKADPRWEKLAELKDRL
jgi:uncharacterized protein